MAQSLPLLQIRVTVRFLLYSPALSHPYPTVHAVNMADPAQPADTVPDAPHHITYQQQASPGTHTHSAHTVPMARITSHTSHVDVGFFDPEGVDQLRRTMSRQESQALAESGLNLDIESTPDPRRLSTHSSQTGATLTADFDGHFSFEKTLRNVMKKYETSSPFLPHCW